MIVLVWFPPRCCPLQDPFQRLRNPLVLREARWWLSLLCRYSCRHRCRTARMSALIPPPPRLSLYTSNAMVGSKTITTATSK
jgi:hypothetical protein